MKGLLFYVVAILILFPARFTHADVPNDELLQAQILVESNGDDKAIGDKHLRNRAFGCLGIRQPAVDDYNRVHKTAHRAEECLDNRELSVKIYTFYIHNYATSRRLGRTPTDEDKARIWNGGPNGWRNPSTVKYWVKVSRVLESK